METETKQQAGLCPCTSTNCSDAGRKPVAVQVPTPTGVTVASEGPGTVTTLQTNRVRIHLTPADLQVVVNFANDHHNLIAQLWTDGR